MKNIMTITLLTLISFFAHAGNGGGTMGQMKIVYAYGEKDGFQYFVVGDLLNNEWQLTPIKTLTEGLADETLLKALLESTITNNWAEVR